jgi:alpha-glucosidase
MPATALRPLHALLMARASRAAQLEHAPGEQPYVVTRSGPTGLHRYAQTWTGDNRTEWKSLKFNLRTGLGLALSGVSNLGHDVGGFAGPRPDPELFLRWVQAGVLMPRFSIHSWNDDGTVNEPWMYPALVPAVRRLMALRQRLVPFFNDLALRYHADCQPMLRPLWLDFPQDPQAWTDGEEHLLGADLLACPVVAPGATRCSAYLPAGADWVHLWSGETWRGGQTVTVEAPLEALPPLFARAGSAMLVDLAPQGFRAGPVQHGIWLFPPQEGPFSWSATDVDGLVGGDLTVRVTGHAEVGQIVIRVEVEGAVNQPLGLILPATERRTVVLTGQVALLHQPFS